MKLGSANLVQAKQNVLQCVAVCCSVLQCGAVWCSVVQCDAVPFSGFHVTWKCQSRASKTHT